MNILVKVSGSISAYKICELVSKLKKENHAVKVAASESSLNFVGSATWEGLAGEVAFTDDFSPNRRMDHIHLNDWADLVVLAPATAQTLDALVQGVGSNVITTLFLARKKTTPYLVFPAMNPRMWSSHSVQKSVESLKQVEGVTVFPPSEGRMACGHIGPGRLNEVEQILDEIYKILNRKKTLKALVTFGGTEESIDGVRSIGNFSTGKTGVSICKVLNANFKVTAMGSEAAWQNAESMWGIEKTTFKSSKNLSDQLFKKISEMSFDLIVHAAAVSDFVPSVDSNKKISSDVDFEIKWQKSPKLLEKIREFSKNKSVKIVSFKLTHNQSEKEVEQKILNQLAGVSDFVVHNELSRVKEETHDYKIWEKKTHSIFSEGESKKEMALDIEKIGRS
jgi:phosphopantothenoylcysteine decarboxylase/phosphopantothenate--cysteine ligase